MLMWEAWATLKLPIGIEKIHYKHTNHETKSRGFYWYNLQNGPVVWISSEQRYRHIDKHPLYIVI